MGTLICKQKSQILLLFYSASCIKILCINFDKNWNINKDFKIFIDSVSLIIEINLQNSATSKK